MQLYFAYGSNMLVRCLRGRVSDATTLGVASVVGRRLQFHKRSNDGSGKCDIVASHFESEIAYGVLYELPDEQLLALDRAEGAGHGYERTKIDVSFDGSVVSATVYLAVPPHTDSRLSPYDWYHALVVAGARQNSLPPDYVSRISAIPSKPDPEPNRKTRLAAIEVLKNVQADPEGNV